MFSKRLAEKIFNYESAYYRDPEVKEIGVLSDNITIQLSSDKLMWYLWMSSCSDQARRFFKAVPALHYDCKNICEILQAQKWVCV